METSYFDPLTRQSGSNRVPMGACSPACNLGSYHYESNSNHPSFAKIINVLPTHFYVFPNDRD
jgi:hypothetical protein